MTGQKLLLISACIQKWEPFCIQKLIMKNEISSVLLPADTISHQVRNVSGEIKINFGRIYWAWTSPFGMTSLLTLVVTLNSHQVFGDIITSNFFFCNSQWYILCCWYLSENRLQWCSFPWWKSKRLYSKHERGESKNKISPLACLPQCQWCQNTTCCLQKCVEV